MTDFNLLEFYGLFYDVVKNWSQKDSEGNIQKRINTFAVIKSSHDINADNLNKDSRYWNKRLFFSRKWADTGGNPSKIAFEYPAAFLVHDESSVLNPFYPNQTETIKFNLFVLGDPKGCISETGDLMTIEERIEMVTNLHRQLRVTVGIGEVADGLQVSQLIAGGGDAGIICDYGEDGTVGYFMNFALQFDLCIEPLVSAEVVEFDEHDKGCC